MQRTFDTPTPPRLELRLAAGQVAIEAVAEATTTDVELDGPAEALEGAVLEQRGDAVVAEVHDRKDLFGLRNRKVLARVRCPEGTRVVVRTKAADVVVHGTLGELDAATASGDLLAEDVERGATLKSASGDLRLAAVGGDASLHTASGDAAAASVGGALRANLVSGDLHVAELAGDATVATVSGDVELECGGPGRVHVQSVSGDVVVAIRRGLAVHVDAGTLSGDTRSDLELGDEAPAGDAPLVELRVKTVSGDVAVVRAGREAQVA